VTLWFTSDTHFDHENMVTKFKLEDGSSARVFGSVEEMNECIIERWNEVVKPSDHIYHLGDLTMHRKIETIQHRILNRLNGHKRLLLGNHDADKVENYLRWFEKIFASRVFDNILLTHIPVHTESLGRFKANVHGHTHHHSYPSVIKIDHKEYGDKERVVPYINVCVEQTEYRPISLEEIKGRI
jgi:calcineurin-like phosphoesterase family protein